MFGWIPIIGPIIDGIVSIFGKFEDTQLGKLKIDGDVAITQVNASRDTLRDFKDDIGVRLARDIILFPTSVWTGLIVWDKIVAIRFPDLVWSVSPLSTETGLAMLPYAVLTFLFGAVAMRIWKR